MMVTEKDIDKEKRNARKLLSAEERIAEEKALQRAKELEKKHIPSPKEELNEIKKLVKEAEHARKLLTDIENLDKNKKNKKK